MYISEKKQLQKAKDFMDNGHYNYAIEILESLNKLPLVLENFRLLFLANCKFNVEEYYVTVDIAEKLLLFNPKNEFASQLKYLSFCELQDFDSALNEIINFLSTNDAILYKVTLNELLNDIKEGFITKEDTIDRLNNLALKNNVALQ